MADTTNKTFAENVNHVAELDNSLGYELALHRSNIVLNENVTYSALTEVRLFNRTTNMTETVSVPSASVTAASLNTYLGTVKTTLESAYPSCVMTHSVTQTTVALGTFNNAQIAVVLSGNNYYLRSINIKISEPDGVQYDIDGQLVSPLEITPKLLSVSAGTLLAIDSVVGIEANINAVVANEANINTLVGSLANVNTIASIQNLANMTTVADDLNAMDLNGIADVTVVANNLVLGAASSINIVSANKSNIDAVAANKTNIDAVAANEANINAVAGSVAEIAANVLLTHADVALTHADVVLTNADVLSADASADIATTQAEIATTKASESLISATAADASKIAAAASELSAANSATTATTKASEASASAAEADLSATAATAKAGEASVSAVNAATSESNASTSEANALASANTAADQADIATTAATEASASANSAASALASVQAIFDNFDDIYLGAKAADPTLDNDGDPLVAGQLYWNTVEEEVRFYNGAVWERPEYSASQSAINAASSASSAATSAANAATSETNASNSEAAASASAISAADSATSASTSATNAASSANAASVSEANAADSATSASASASAAEISATEAASLLGQFDDRYLGPKASDPLVDNDGNVLLVGALYYNTSTNTLRIWTGSVWNAAAFDATGAVTSFNTRVGAVTLLSTDVTTALGYTPEPANANIQTHISSISNPHSTTAAQVGAYTTSQVDTLLAGKSDIAHNHDGVYEPANANIQSHISSTSNPHSVTADQVGAYTKAEVDTALGGYSLTSHAHTGVYEPADATILKDADIGVTVQPYNASTTLQGNTFNGANQLVKLDATGKLPAIDGSQLTGVSTVTDLDGLSDVVVSTPTTGQVLKYNGTNWVNGADNDTVYTHPTTSGNKHIPAGGSSGQILRWSADGTAVWGADNDTVYTHPTGDGYLHVPATGSTNAGKVLTAGATAGSLSWETPATGIIKSPMKINPPVEIPSTTGFAKRIDLTTSLSILISPGATLTATAYNHNTNTAGSTVMLRNANVFIGYEIIDSSTFIVASYTGTVVEVVVCTVSGTTITVGTPAAFTASAAVSYNTGNGVSNGFFLTKIGTSFVLTYVKATATPSMCVMACTVSGTTVTLGSEVILDSVAGIQNYYSGIDAISSSGALVVYSSNTLFYATPITVSGTTITKGTSATTAITNNSVWYIFGRLESGRWAGIVVNTVAKPILISVSGTTATITVYGTPSPSIDAASSFYTSRDLSYIIKNNTVLIYPYQSNSYLYKITDNAGTINYSTIGTMMNSLYGCVIDGDKLVEISNGYYVEYYLNNDSVTISYYIGVSPENTLSLPYTTKTIFNKKSKSPLVLGDTQFVSNATENYIYKSGIGIQKTEKSIGAYLNVALGSTDNSNGFSTRYIDSKLTLRKVYL